MQVKIYVIKLGLYIKTKSGHFIGDHALISSFSPLVHEFWSKVFTVVYRAGNQPSVTVSFGDPIQIPLRGGDNNKPCECHLRKGNPST